MHTKKNNDNNNIKKETKERLTTRSCNMSLDKSLTKKKEEERGRSSRQDLVNQVYVEENWERQVKSELKKIDGIK